MRPLPEETHRAHPHPAASGPLDPAAAYAEISPLIAERMARVEKEFSAWLESNVEIVSRLSAYVSEGCGKRLRPALLLLCAGLVDYDGEHDVLFGTVFEFIHTATLVHDDIIDEADVRRGRASLNRSWGNDLSVLMGDHLYLKAMKMALRAGDLRILDLLADVTLKMIEGELIQAHVNGRPDITEEQYLDIAERKTALLFSACCQVPAMLARRPAAEERALADYGRNLGMAFQVVDDILDLTSNEKTLGKPVGGDLRKGRLTLPLVYLLRFGKAQHRKIVLQVVHEETFSSASREQILTALIETGALQMSREIARSYAAGARCHMQGFPSNPFRRALLAVPDFVLSRES
ncbi:MAG: polyprenyl synthetase family protein [Acidobacteria bacterium]|nr:MAG: polyprenyl synthetase family protein [Acidobacteriota bacterium]